MARPASDTVTVPAKSNQGLVLAAGRSTEIAEFEASVVEFFVEAAEILGVPKSVAAIYGIVFASPVPLSFAEIEARLNFSKGSVSQGLRVLREVGAIKEVSSAADRAERFAPETEMRNLIGRFLQNRVERQLERGRGRLDELNGSASIFEPAEQKILRQRLQKLQRWHDRTRASLPLIRTFLRLGG